MNVLSVCNTLFPAVEFTGGSKYHASLGAAFELTYASAREGLSLIHTRKLPSLAWRGIQRRFGAFEFWVTSDEFAVIALRDWGLSLLSKPIPTPNDALKNPVTGNYFHPIGVYHGDVKLLAGIRFWIDPLGNNEWQIFFRFRIQALNDEEEDRRAVQSTLAEVKNQVIQVESAIQLSDPYTGRRHKERAKD